MKAAAAATAAADVPQLAVALVARAEKQRSELMIATSIKTETAMCQITDEFQRPFCQAELKPLLVVRRSVGLHPCNSIHAVVAPPQLQRCPDLRQ